MATHRSSPFPDPPDLPPGDEVGAIANDRWKARWRSWFWSSMIVAISIHFAVFALWPDMHAGDVSFTTTPTISFDVPPEIDIPSPPDPLPRPAAPKIADSFVAAEVTIGETTFDANPVIDLPAPPTTTARAEQDESMPRFTPHTVSPILENRAEVSRMLEREYPPLLKESGVGGVVQVWLYIDTAGVVQDLQVAESSGYDAFDRTALKIAERMRFTPALNRDQKVPVWVAVPVRFIVNRIRNRPPGDF